MFGRKSEQQAKPHSGRKRGQQPGSNGHGRTQRPELAERTEKRNPANDARVCSCCGKPYAANGERCTTVIEVEVKAHKRRIVRPRWRRTCECASSAREVTAPPVARLFENTPYGISVWVCVLFERFVCCRPLHRVAAWLADMGLAVSPGTLGDSVKRFVPLFEPVAGAVLAHQNTAALRHADETTWRVQALREKGRSSRCWLWTSVSDDAVYFHIDPSRSTEVAKTLFGAAACVLLLVCDRLSTYKSLARELGGKVVLCWCWAHQRRSFLDCAAGHVRLTRWCQGWIERIAAIYRLNDARLEHYDPTLERQRPEFDARQRELIAGPPPLNRLALSKEFCRRIDWFKPDGGLKDMMARVAMLAMHRDGLITLPAPTRRQNRPGPIVFGPHTEPPLFAAPTTLDEVRPLDFRTVVRATHEGKLWNEFVPRYHYLGYKTLVGAQMRYAVHDRNGWPIAMLGFSTAAWRLAPRDNFIGWTPQMREKILSLVVDNPRFLILPWIEIPNLGSHILAIVRRRLPEDWAERYNTTPVLIETFVETPRYTGAVYRASGWLHVGTTRGRGRYDRDKLYDKPRKDVWLRPLRRDWKRILSR